MENKKLDARIAIELLQRLSEETQADIWLIAQGAALAENKHKIRFTVPQRNNT